VLEPQLQHGTSFKDIKNKLWSLRGGLAPRPSRALVHQEGRAHGHRAAFLGGAVPVAAAVLVLQTTVLRIRYVYKSADDYSTINFWFFQTVCLIALDTN